MDKKCIDSLARAEVNRALTLFKSSNVGRRMGFGEKIENWFSHDFIGFCSAIFMLFDHLQNNEVYIISQKVNKTIIDNIYEKNNIKENRYKITKSA